VWKVEFGSRHFAAIDVDYKVVSKSDDLDKDEPPLLVENDGSVIN
jgi:hypothetical protein